MARRKKNGPLTATAQGLGAALGQVAARLDAWKQQRDEITADLNRIVRGGLSMLRELGTAAAPSAPARKGKGGRPKGYKMSEETKKKLRAAWKRRKAAMKDGKDGANG
jgi:hypothetical protein